MKKILLSLLVLTSVIAHASGVSKDGKGKGSEECHPHTLEKLRKSMAALEASSAGKDLSKMVVLATRALPAYVRYVDCYDEYLTVQCSPKKFASKKRGKKKKGSDVMAGSRNFQVFIDCTAPGAADVIAKTVGYTLPMLDKGLALFTGYLKQDSAGLAKLRGVQGKLKVILDGGDFPVITRFAKKNDYKRDVAARKEAAIKELTAFLDSFMTVVGVL